MLFRSLPGLPPPQHAQRRRASGTPVPPPQHTQVRRMLGTPVPPWANVYRPCGAWSGGSEDRRRDPSGRKPPLRMTTENAAYKSESVSFVSAFLHARRNCC
jgi:hypothetical protein